MASGGGHGSRLKFVWASRVTVSPVRLQKPAKAHVVQLNVC